MFDLSEYSKDSKFYKKSTKKLPDEMKDEKKGVPVVEFKLKSKLKLKLKLKSKMYCFTKNGGLGDRKAEGINKSVAKK